MFTTWAWEVSSQCQTSNSLEYNEKQVILILESHESRWLLPLLSVRTCFISPIFTYSSNLNLSSKAITAQIKSLARYNITFHKLPSRATTCLHSKTPSNIHEKYRSSTRCNRTAVSVIRLSSLLPHISNMFATLKLGSLWRSFRSGEASDLRTLNPQKRTDEQDPTCIGTCSPRSPCTLAAAVPWVDMRLLAGRIRFLVFFSVRVPG